MDPGGAALVSAAVGVRVAFRDYRGAVGCSTRSPDLCMDKAIPYGVYDLAANDGFVSAGVDHDTPVFAVKSIESWWKHVGAPRYPDARELFITADAGGSTGRRTRLWKAELQRLADARAMAIHVSHVPPGTSKWNRMSSVCSRSSRSTGAAGRSGPARRSSP